MATKSDADETGDPYEDYPQDVEKELSAAEILQIVTLLKEIGNKMFKSGSSSLALGKYQKGLRYLHEAPDITDKDSATITSQLAALKITLNLNSALIGLKLKKFDDAARSATYVLEGGATDADRAKAFYRRAMASAALKQHEEAEQDLEEALKLAPDDAAIKTELASVKKERADQKRKEKAAYRKFFQ